MTATVITASDALSVPADLEASEPATQTDAADLTAEEIVSATITQTVASAADCPTDLAGYTDAIIEVMAATDGLHPVTQAAILFHAWRMLGQASQTPDGVRDVEAATLAARHGAAMARRDSGRSSGAFERRADGSGGARFLPLALTGPTALRAAGPVPDRLARWIAGATQATLAALLHVDRIGDWQVHATAVTHDLSGRTPARLIEAMRYGSLGGGKRLRPAFCHWGYAAAGGDPADPMVANAGAAFELMHAFALFHDDVMDDATSRRGNTTTHTVFAGHHRDGGWAGEARRFGEGVAILVGDLAFVYGDMMMTGPMGLVRATLSHL